MKNNILNIQRILSIIGITVLLFLGYSLITAPESSPSKQGIIRVVAAENFWGSLISQIGGNHVHVVSLVTDPNADPHEYSSNVTTAQAVSSAGYVIENGAGYDSWMDKLVSASRNDSRKVFTVADLLGKKEGDNPHFWYNPIYVNQVAFRMTQDLSGIDPANMSYYQSQYKKLQSELTTYQAQIQQIKQQYSGVKVAATEDIFVYLADAFGLDLVSPPDFTQAVAEGNDPPASSVVTFEQQLKSGSVKLLVFNKQTETPLTNEMKTIAANSHIPIVGITETLQPPNVTFQSWMSNETSAIANALHQSTSR